MKKRFPLALLFFLFIPTVVSANIVWPSIYIAEGMRSFWVIVLGLIIETVIVKIFEKQTWLRAVLISVIMNLVSTLLGIILLPAIGFVGVILLGFLAEIIPALGNTFDLPVWIFSYILAILTNVVIEGYTTQFTARIPFKNMFWWMLLANTLSVAVCVAVHGFTLDALVKGI